MKIKCQKCKGKGGIYVIKPTNMRINIETWQACIECAGKGRWYNRKTR